MHKSFSFKGINNSTDVMLAQDGDCLDVVNLRMVNGSLRPMPMPCAAATLPGRYSMIYWHEMAQCYIAVTDDAVKTLHFYNVAWQRLGQGGVPLVFSDLCNVTGVELLGNVVCCLTSQGICYLLFEKETYRMLGERPAIPDVTVTVVSKVETVTTEESYSLSVGTDDLENTWSYNEKGYIDECISVLNKSGHYIDRALFRVALRIYDGSYINCSGIIYVSDEERGDDIERDAYNMLSEPLGSDSVSKFKVRTRGFKAEFAFDTAALAAWKNVVVGIDLFSTGSIPGKKCSLVGRSNKFDMYTEKTPDELWNDVSGAALYYKVAEYDIDGNLLHGIDDVSSVNLALQQGLDTAALPSSFSSICAGNGYVYNGRLHIASLREYLFPGYDAGAFRPVAGGSGSVDMMTVHTKIRSTQGDFVVSKSFAAPVLGHNGYSHELSPMLSYPDARACEITVFLVIDGTVYRKAFPLRAHNYLNVAYYLHKWYLPYTVSQQSVFANGGAAVGAPVADVLRMFNYEPGVHEVVYSSSLQSWTYNGQSFPPESYTALRTFAVPRDIADGDKIVFTITRKTSDYSFKDIYNIPVDDTWEIADAVPETEEHPSEERFNVMKVSMPDNPFVFLAKCTYAPSQGNIVGMAGNTSVMSQGQFGQFPLYLFCSDGIWAMQVDTTASVAYLTSHQVSRDICVNSKSVCGITGGVVFATGQGLMLITGNRSKKISTPAEGSGRLLTGIPAELFRNISETVSLQGDTGRADINTFLLNATVTYIATHNELLISNPNYEYSYVFLLETGLWSRFAERFTGYAKGSVRALMLTVNASMTKVCSISSLPSDSNNVLLFTRPQLWGTKLPKRVVQLVLHATAEMPVEPTAGVPLLACYMLGSNDGVHFKLIAGTSKTQRAQDVRFPYFPSRSYKYYLFAIVGEMGKGSALTGMEIAISPAWNNRLR